MRLPSTSLALTLCRTSLAKRWLSKRWLSTSEEPENGLMPANKFKRVWGRWGEAEGRATAQDLIDHPVGLVLAIEPHNSLLEAPSITNQLLQLLIDTCGRGKVMHFWAEYKSVIQQSEWSTSPNLIAFIRTEKVKAKAEFERDWMNRDAKIFRLWPEVVSLVFVGLICVCVTPETKRLLQLIPSTALYTSRRFF